MKRYLVTIRRLLALSGAVVATLGTCVLTVGRNSQSTVRPKPTQIHLPGFMERRRALHRDDKLLICHRVLVEPEVACSLHDDKESWRIFDSLQLARDHTHVRWGTCGMEGKRLSQLDDRRRKGHDTHDRRDDGKGPSHPSRVLRCHWRSGNDQRSGRRGRTRQLLLLYGLHKRPESGENNELSDGFSPLTPVLQKHLTETCPRALPVR